MQDLKQKKKASSGHVVFFVAEICLLVNQNGFTIDRLDK